MYIHLSAVKAISLKFFCSQRQKKIETEKETERKYLYIINDVDQWIIYG